MRPIVVPASAPGHHVLFTRWLEEGGVDPASVRYSEAPFSQLGDLLRGRRLDAALLVEPFVSRAMKADPGMKAVNYLAAFPDGLLISAWCAERGWAEQNSSTVAAFRTALNEAVAAIAADEPRARQDLAAWLKLPPDVVAAIALPHFTPALKSSDVTAWTDMAKRQRLIDHDIGPASVVVP